MIKSSVIALNLPLVINVYDSFWGPVEVADMMIKRFLDTADHSEKTEFICVDKNISVEYFGKLTIKSKPKYLIYHKGLQQSMIEGIDFPTLCNEIERCFSLIET